MDHYGMLVKHIGKTVRIISTADKGKTGILYDVGYDGFSTVIVDGVMRGYNNKDFSVIRNGD